MSLGKRVGLRWRGNIKGDFILNPLSDQIRPDQSLSRVRLCAVPWTAACQSLLTIEFSMQEYWSELPCPFPGDLPDPEIEPRSPSWQADLLLSDLPGKLYLQFSSVTQSCPTLCNPINCSKAGFLVQHQLPELAKTHVPWVGDAVELSHPMLPSAVILESQKI